MGSRSRILLHSYLGYVHFVTWRTGVALHVRIW